MRQLVGVTRWFVLVGFLALLAACGSSGEGPRVLTDDDYKLNVNAVLGANEYDAGTSIWVLEARSFNGNVLNRRYIEPSFSVGAGGLVDFQLDARDLNADDPPLDPREYLAWHIGRALAATEIEVDDSAARIKVASSIAVFQTNPNMEFGVNRMASHTLMAWIRTETLQTSMVPVFADRAVSANANWISNAQEYEMDVALQPGWNFLHYERGTETDWVLTARAATGSETFEHSPTRFTTASGQVEEISGVSWFAEHEYLNDPNPTSWHAYYFPGGSAQLYVHQWLGFGDNTSVMVPFDQIYPGALDSSNVSFDPPEAVGLIAAPFGYAVGEAGTPGWQNDPNRALGRIAIASGAGNYVMLVYADRDVTVSFTGPVSGILGSSLSADHADLELEYGWNRVEVVPDGVDVVQLRTTYEFSPDWGIVSP